MPSLALTGNIGSGKTSALNLLVSLMQEEGIAAVRFSADEANRTLLETDPEVRKLIRSSLGGDSYTPDGLPNRETISLRISADPQARNTLEGILHPRLERIWKPLAAAQRLSDQTFFVAEIPLLYEKGLSSCEKCYLVSDIEPQSDLNQRYKLEGCQRPSCPGSFAVEEDLREKPI
jgi:dephospho-CoA kinase